MPALRARVDVVWPVDGLIDTWPVSWGQWAMTPRRFTVRSTADLPTCWHRVLGPLGFASRQVFAVLVDRDGQVFRSVVHVAGCPARPDPEMVANLADALRSALDEADPHGSCAVLWARPTGAGTRATDIEWARCLGDELDRAGVRRWPVHVADDSVLSVVAPDDLVA